MALRGASTTVDSDYIDWAGLAAENAAVVCTVKAVEAPKDYGNGEVAAVRARVIVLTGKQAGTVYEDERILKAGIRNKLQTVGDDVVGRLDVYGTRRAVGLQAEHEGDIALAERALKKFGAVPEQRSASNGSAKAAKPTDDSGDDEPPF
ncbi:MAG: hypothetical protein ACRDRY_22295 [Pseudonocardiaceae bacterium]